MPRGITIRVQDSSRKSQPIRGSTTWKGVPPSNATGGKLFNGRSSDVLTKKPAEKVVQIENPSIEIPEICLPPDDAPAPLIVIKEPPTTAHQESESESDDDEGLEPPKNRYARRQSVCAEAYNPDESDDEDEKLVVHPKSDVQRKRLNEAVGNILLFKNLDNEQLNNVLDAMFERKTTADEHIIDQGDDGDNFYVIDRGIFDIYVKIDGSDKKVCICGEI
uniref:Cyclic nucleotide-binding domain-containing protein n=1 Tax=Clytia hemisphaerica TaxID=252671 RepID=A0A7M5V758_9CNID